MDGLRGSNMDESDFADDSVVMQLVEVAHDDSDQLPLSWDPDRIADFWGRRPVAVIRRAFQLLGKLLIATVLPGKAVYVYDMAQDIIHYS